MSASRRRRRRSDHGGEEHHVDERWMASYMDMVTVLMCLFIVLYAMSTVDSAKFEKLRNSLATGFGTTVSTSVDTAEGTVVHAQDVGKDAEGFSGNQALAVAEAKNLTGLQKKMQKALDAAGLAGNVTMTVDTRGLTVRLVGTQTFFQPDSAELNSHADRVLDTIASTMTASKKQISIEGHTADLLTVYPSVWELSTARATTVLRRLVEHDGVPATVIRATGFGSSRPLTTGRTPADHERNRRVDIVLLSDQPEAVRKLLPAAAATTGKAATGTATTGKAATGTTAEKASTESSSSH
ncbi:flagellar motor protein MotB [Tersicoccus sp. Bi-70]|uniref:OmpA/MotB family protein n=1 Tax=Tersicoccus sp. Bi-70 TaxID=1897634 RepID=UPI0009754666|nr:flagellar motor protein MotB [Tersicoccus sp. Bi-70]OMH30566.1 flagellar motor protein MotB [Tersicoccus sp. Bi-70]